MTGQQPASAGAAATDAAALDDTRSVASKSLRSRWLATSGSWVLILDVVLFAAFGFGSSGNVFWSLANVQNLLLGGTEALLLGLGLAVLLGAGFIDLSLGANLVLSSVVGASVIQAVAGTGGSSGDSYHSVGLALVLGFVACVATGVVFGLVNGVIGAYVDVNPLIVTLATLGIGTSLALIVTGGSDIGGLPSQLQSGFGLVTVVGIPLPAVVAVLIAVILWAVVRFTRFGMHTLAIGSERKAAERVGLNVRAHLVKLAVLAGGLAGLAGFIDLSRFGATTQNGHVQDGLAALTAVVIGGTLLEGGVISIIGTVWGTLLAVVLQGGLVVIGVPTFYQQLAIGLVLILAVSIDRYRFRRARAG